MNSPKEAQQYHEGLISDYKELGQEAALKKWCDIKGIYVKDYARRVITDFIVEDFRANSAIERMYPQLAMVSEQKMPYSINEMDYGTPNTNYLVCEVLQEDNRFNNKK